ncbi:MAG: uracil-DNA glycosylase [Candidatus Bipolaricaulia bacterium]
MTEIERLSKQVIACTRCPRLVEYRDAVARKKRRAFQDEAYWGRPVPGFGDPDARLLIVGLAPAAHGANRTGRMFTGDGTGAGGFLMEALYRAGFANQPTSEHCDDGLALKDAYLTAVVRCAPPNNRPTAQEIGNCMGYLKRELVLLSKVHVVLALGQIAFVNYLSLLKRQGVSVPRPRPRFTHGATYTLDSRWPSLIASYHPSRQNTQTGRLTEAMFDRIFEQVKRLINIEEVL